MRLFALILILIISIVLTGCTIKLPGNNKLSGETIDVENESSSLDGTFLIAPDNDFLTSRDYTDELNDAYIVFAKDNTFCAYLGFANMIYGKYTMTNNIITCNATTFTNEYSPVQNISASVTFKNNNNTILTVMSASPSFHIKTTNMNEDGNWVYDGGEKDMPLSVFSEGISYTLYTPYN